GAEVDLVPDATGGAAPGGGDVRPGGARGESLARLPGLLAVVVAAVGAHVLAGRRVLVRRDVGVDEHLRLRHRGRPRAVPGEDLLALGGLDVGAGDVAVVVRQDPLVHDLAPQRREVGDTDHGGVAGRELRGLLEAAQDLVAAHRVGVVVRVALQAVQEDVGDQVVGVPRVRGAAALVATGRGLLPQQAVVLEVVDHL